MSTYKNLMTVCCAAVLALGLAACGSSSDKKEADTGMDGDGMEMPTPAGPSVADLFATASNAEMAAGDAKDDANDALKSAMENAGKLTVLMVRGNSTTATTNAQAILDARDDVGEALMAAQMALADIEQAQADAADNADDPNHGALTDALAEAKMVVEADIETIEGIRDGLALEGYVEMVTGTDADDLDTAADIGKGVAMEVAGAIDADATPVALVPAAPAATVRTATRMDDHRGYTWEQLAGKLGLEPRWLSTPGTDRVGAARGVLADGIDAPQAVLDLDSVTDGAGTVNSRTAHIGTYKGLTGQVICSGGPCAVKDSKLVAGTGGTSPVTGEMFQGHWYFAPDNSDSPTVYYVAVPSDDPGAETTYMVETMYASYGYWLDRDSNNDDALQLNRYAGSTAAALVAESITTVNDAPATTLTDTSASYEGPAIGLSVQKTEVNGKVTEIYSGGFEATASLTATWGTDAALTGSITDFTGGDHVNPDWIVTLQSTGLGTTGALDGDTGVAQGSGPGGAGATGTWSAQAYGGSATARPAGIYGGFNAHFVDGHASGVYATRKK